MTDNALTPLAFRISSETVSAKKGMQVWDEGKFQNLGRIGRAISAVLK